MGWSESPLRLGWLRPSCAGSAIVAGCVVAAGPRFSSRSARGRRMLGSGERGVSACLATLRTLACTGTIRSALAAGLVAPGPAGRPGCDGTGVRVRRPAEAEPGLVAPHPMQHDGELAGDRDPGARHRPLADPLGGRSPGGMPAEPTGPRALATVTPQARRADHVLPRTSRLWAASQSAARAGPSRQRLTLAWMPVGRAGVRPGSAPTSRERRQRSGRSPPGSADPGLRGMDAGARRRLVARKAGVDLPAPAGAHDPGQGGRRRGRSCRASSS